MSTAVSPHPPIDIATRQQALVDLLLENESIRSERVEAAFRAVPRHPFLPNTPPEEVYVDEAIPTHFAEDGRAISSSSQPAIMAIMLEQLDLQPGQHVLEVGAGTGYNAALMGHLVGENGRVTAVDIDADIVAAAQEHLAAIGCTNVTVICGDGMDGYAAHAPYDRIILTVGGWEISPAWLAQLKPDGRILLPLSLNGPHYAIAFDRAPDHLVSVSIHACGFMKLRGPQAGPEFSLPLNDARTIHLEYEDTFSQPRQIDPDQIRAWIDGPWQEGTTNLEATPREVWRSFLLWLALREPNLTELVAGGEAATAETIPSLLGMDGPHPWRVTTGVVTGDSMAFYNRLTTRSKSGEGEPETFMLGFRVYGPGETAGQRLQDHAVAWHAAGRPGVVGMRVRVYPVNQVSKGDTAVTRRWHTFIVDWPPP
ncbi:MAG TPA: methyltransferase, FxLD system [Chloroflexota bacterium]|nr:methyltransferase, FxLD system [Chloroflexota bacterium]